MGKKHTRHRRQKAYKRKIARTRSMKGGAYSQTELQQLQTNGFSEEQIQTLQEMNIPYNLVMERINQAWNQGDDGFHGNSDDFAEQIMSQLSNNNSDLFDDIPHADDDIHELSFNGDNGSLHLSDLNSSQDSMFGNTTVGDESYDSQLSNGSLHLSDLNSSQDSMFGNTTVGDDSLSNSSMSSFSMGSEYGGKRRRKSRKGKKSGKKSSKRKSRKKSSRKSRKQKGGTCYGTGVGANSLDPNYSIYNTQQLNLFPYRPN
jgi:hypothetical protein